ncbi:MAG TPA: hypothetical protein VEC08_00255 [Nitrososphaerales archaeon]|nr:hypothetical protein [Nitrososphaerales archaeon]
MEKKQEASETEQQQAGEVTKGKKGAKEQKAPPQQQKRLPFLVPKLTETEMLKSLSPLKAITTYAASKALGVNASIATGILRELEVKKAIVKVGGFSGHEVWKVT